MTITIDELKKINLRVATILEAQRVEKSDKLIKLQLDIGEEKRQIVAGIGAIYSPETLIGKQIVVVVNLEPRKLMGEESNGMLLATGDELGPVLIIPESQVAAGSPLR